MRSTSWGGPSPALARSSSRAWATTRRTSRRPRWWRRSWRSSSPSGYWVLQAGTVARTPDVLEVRNFAQIRRARIEFGDVTVLVGPQATGKSLILQLLKWSIDSQNILWRLGRYGLDLETRKGFYELYLGEGMAQAWRQASS